MNASLMSQLSLQSPLKAGLYVYEMLYFLSLSFWELFCAVCEWEKRRNLCTKRVLEMFTYLCCKHCNYRIINTIQDMVRNIVRLRTARQNRILGLSFPLFIISSWNMYREKLSHRVDLCRLVYTIIVLVVNVIWLHKVKLLILKRLYNGEQRIDVISEKWFFCAV